MTSTEFVPNQIWAYRKGRSEPALKVKVLERVVRGKQAHLKIRHLDAKLEGLEEWVIPGELVCTWKDWPKVVRDEEREAAFYAYLETIESPSRILGQAAQVVFNSTGEDCYVEDHRSFTRIYDPQTLERLADRIHLEDRPWNAKPCFKNRKGELYVPNGLLVDLAIAFAVAEPQTVNLYLDMEEEEYRARGFGYEGRFYHQRLLKSMPAWSIARHWSGIKTERDHILREQERLRGLVQEAIAQLLKAGLERQGKMLERKLLLT